MLNYNPDTRKMSMVRGDTGRFMLTDVTLYDETNGEITDYTPTAADTFRFTLAKKIGAEEPLLSKDAPGDNPLFEIASADTATAEPGDYTYDIRLLLENGDVHTCSQASAFELLGNVGGAA